MIEIKNGCLKASINPLGAELQSLQVNHNQHELIWQRDPAVWVGSAPILFPIVGKLIDDCYTLAGRTYTMPKHGLVRRQAWSVVESGEGFAELEIADSEALRESYPFCWKLGVRFELSELQLSVRYTVTNLGTDTLYFSIGSHPAFNLNFGSDSVDDYYLHMDSVSTPWQRHKLLEQGLSKEAFDVHWQGQDLALSEDLFDGDALVFINAGCKQVTLCCKQDARQVLINTGAAPDLGIWSKPGAPYVCIEPWYGYDDPEDHDQEFSTKPGIQMIEGQGEFSTAYAIALNEAWL